MEGQSVKLHFAQLRTNTEEKSGENQLTHCVPVIVTVRETKLDVVNEFHGLFAQIRLYSATSAWKISS